MTSYSACKNFIKTLRKVGSGEIGWEFLIEMCKAYSYLPQRKMLLEVDLIILTQEETFISVF